MLGLGIGCGIIVAICALFFLSIIKSRLSLLGRKEWSMKKAIILQRDNYECQICHTKAKNLHVHHKYYSKYPDGERVKPWEYDNNALITICPKCHKWIHAQKKIKTYYRKRMPWN